jgi:hypothetical protein
MAERGVAGDAEVGYLEIGAGRLYETMVFRATGERCTRPDCDCGQPEWSGSELDMDGYNLRGAAQRGHYAMCETWALRTVDRPLTAEEVIVATGGSLKPDLTEIK